MQIFELILQNVKPQKIAEDAVKLVSTSGGDISCTVGDFLQSICDAIRFRYHVTPEECDQMKFNWPEELATVFRYEHQRCSFELYEKFLGHFCDIMYEMGYQRELVRILETFVKFATSLQPAWAVNLYGPLSLIGICLLRKIHVQRTDSPNESEVLDNICQALFEVARKGIGPDVSHDLIAKGLGQLLQEDYDYFWKTDKDIFNFFTDCLEYEIVSSGGQTFNYIRGALENKRITGGPKDSLIKFLINPELVEPWCGLCQYENKNLVRSTLKFLNTLLKYLPILECFTRPQVHAVFRCALQSNFQIRTLAVQFYIGFMKRNFKEKFILRDILDFYLHHSSGTGSLDNFFASLWVEFPYVSHFESYVRILKKSDWNLNILCVTAQFTYRVYKRLYRECDDNDEYGLRLSKFLLVLPEILVALQDKWEVKGILSQVYSITEPQKALITIKEFPIASDGYIKYALKYLSNNIEDYKITLCTVNNMLDLMDFFNNDEEMEYFSNALYVKYKQLMANPSELTGDKIHELEHILVLLSSATDQLLAMNGETVFELACDLISRLTESEIFEELSFKYNRLINAFAVRTCGGGLKTLSALVSRMADQDVSVEIEVLLGRVDPFIEYLINRLGEEDKPKVTLLFAEVAMQAICDILRIFNVDVNREIYHVLVSCVNNYVFETNPPDKSLYDLQSQRRILQSFTLLHKFIDVPTALIWKILIHFDERSEFETELLKLLDTLLTYKSDDFQELDLFTNSVSVAIFNTFKRGVKSRQLQKMLRAYKRYIDKKMPGTDQRLMRIQMITSIIDLIEKSLEAGDISQESNRVELLSSLVVFLTDIHPFEAITILEQCKKLLECNLSTVEQETVANFQKQVSQ